MRGSQACLIDAVILPIDGSYEVHTLAGRLTRTCVRFFIVNIQSLQQNKFFERKNLELSKKFTQQDRGIEILKIRLENISIAITNVIFAVSIYQLRDRLCVTCGIFTPTWGHTSVGFVWKLFWPPSPMSQNPDINIIDLKCAVCYEQRRSIILECGHVECCQSCWHGILDASIAPTSQ